MKTSQEKRNGRFGTRVQLLLQSNKGNAAVMVLSVVLILTAFGIVSLLASAANIKMGSRYRVWSSEFYTLDSQAEESVRQVDALLKQADDYTQAYMKNGIYKKTFVEVSALSPSEMDPSMKSMLTDPAQTLFFNKQWGKASGQDLMDFINAEPDRTTALENYQTAMLDYTELYSNKIYFYFANKLLSEPLLAASGISFSLQSNFAFDSNLSPTVWEDADVAVWNSWPVRIAVFGGAANNRKSVKAELRILKPDFEAIVKVIGKPMDGNPLWGYALAAEGKVTFEGSNTVFGDVFAASRLVTPPVGVDKTAVSIDTTGTVEIHGNVYAGGDVRVDRGGGNLIVWNKDDSAPDSRNPEYGQKMKIYTDINGSPKEFLMDTTSNNLYKADSNQYSEDTAPADAVPMLYRDGNKWGNIYCSDLEMASVTGGSIQVYGNVITGDDIEMHADLASITIEGNYVGTKSDSDINGNPNGSSSVINNTALQDPNADVPVLNSRIIFGGGIVVPGIAFGEYDNGPTTTQNGKYYYRTSESVTGKTAETFQWYQYPESPFAEALSNAGVIAALPLEYELDGSTYYLKDYKNDLQKEKADFYQHLNVAGPHTFVYSTAASKKGYTLGAAMLHNGMSATTADVFMPGMTPDDSLVGQATNDALYNQAKDLLPVVLDKKTHSFGLDNTLPMSAYVDPPTTSAEIAAFMAGSADTQVLGTSATASSLPASARMYYAPGNLTLDLNTNLNGILYCKGDLTISGAGTFSGIVLCEGNVRIRNTAKLVFSDYLLVGTQDSLLRGVENESIRNFFLPGAKYGSTYSYVDTYDTTSGSKTAIKRYRITKWLEGQEN